VIMRMKHSWVVVSIDCAESLQSLQQSYLILIGNCLLLFRLKVSGLWDSAMSYSDCML